MDNEVRITLKALTSDVSPAERIITLNPDQPTIPIGRASKSVSKGLLGAVDNAWFDSPVMSRDHAEISIDAQEKNITIQDIGSMHGTYLNGVELPRKTPMAVDDGDVLVFGAEVRRGPETFPACKFQVSYQFVPYKSKNTFTFPDSSDVEDEQEEEEEAYDEFSEDDMGEREQTSSEDGASIESPLAKVPAVIDPIDLTGDESPRIFASNRIDLTGETTLEQGLMDMMEGRPADIPQDAHPVSIGVYAGNNPILVDSEDEDTHFSMDSDDQSEIIEDEVSSENDSQDDAEHSEPSDDEEEAGDAEDSDEEDVQESSAMEPMEPTPINSNTRFALATHDHSTVRLSDIRTRIEEPEDLAEIDDESDLGLSEAGDAGIRALFEDGLLRHSYDDPYPILPGEALNETGASSTFSAQAPNHISFASASSMQAHQGNASGPAQNTSEYRRFQAAQSTIRHELKLSNLFARQPSPSDAAMVKGRMPAPESTHIGVCDLEEFSRPVVPQTLGEKTGKGDFFEAREVNKAKFGLNNKPGQASSLTGMTAPLFAGSFEENRPQLTTAATNPFERRAFGASQFSKPGSGPTFSSSESYYPITSHKASSAVNKISPADITYFPTREQCSFLDNPAHGPALDRAPSPEPYMTSAVNFHAATHKPRSGLGINDIINTASTTTQSLKRKADDISDATDAEVRMWAQSSTASNDDVKGSADVATSEEIATVSSPITGVVPSVQDAPAPRPAKKLKKLLENVGYAALGGVAVGAGLFSVLVATAPDFL